MAERVETPRSPRLSSVQACVCVGPVLWGMVGVYVVCVCIVCVYAVCVVCVYVWCVYVCV